MLAYLILVSLLFHAAISIFNIIFTLVSVLFLNPLMDFESGNKITLICLYAGMRV